MIAKYLNKEAASGGVTSKKRGVSNSQSTQIDIGSVTNSIVSDSQVNMIFADVAVNNVHGAQRAGGLLI